MFILEEEYHILGYHLVTIKFNTMIQEVMVEDFSSWEALVCVRLGKSTMPGFDVRIHLDTNHQLNGIVCMVPMI